MSNDECLELNPGHYDLIDMTKYKNIIFEKCSRQQYIER